MSIISYQKNDLIHDLYLMIRSQLKEIFLQKGEWTVKSSIISYGYLDLHKNVVQLNTLLFETSIDKSPISLFSEVSSFFQNIENKNMLDNLEAKELVNYLTKLKNLFFMDYNLFRIYSYSRLILQIFPDSNSFSLSLKNDSSEIHTHLNQLTNRLLKIKHKDYFNHYFKELIEVFHNFSENLTHSEFEHHSRNFHLAIVGVCDRVFGSYSVDVDN